MCSGMHPMGRRTWRDACAEVADSLGWTGEGRRRASGGQHFREQRTLDDTA
jgi:hypothetical protein